MTKYGTCFYTVQPAKIVRQKPNPQPHERPQVELLPHFYLCGILNYSLDPAPPPIQRRNGTFELHEDDCCNCRHYIPADQGFLLKLLKTHGRRLKSKRRRAMSKARGSAV